MNITEITSTKKQTAERLRLAPYCRVSSDSADQLHSFAAQIRYYSDYAKKHPEYQLVDIYADEGITGTEMKKRDELKRLIADCKKGKVDRIIVKSVSRLARNTEELLVLLRMCKEIGVSVYFEEQGIDTEKLNMEMIVTFPGMAAQQESALELSKADAVRRLQLHLSGLRLRPQRRADDRQRNGGGGHSADIRPIPPRIRYACHCENTE